MTTCDLAHESKAEPRTGARFACGACAEEGFEDALAIGIGDAQAVVEDAEGGAVCHRFDFDLDGRRAVAFGVFDQVADQTAQQARVALDDDGRAGRACVLEARGFFGGERQEIDVFDVLQTG